MSISNRKVVIVGAGHVGSHVGYALISQSLADEIVYIDSDHAKAVAQAFDLTDATNYLPVRTKVTAGDYSDAKDAQIMIISAGPLPTGNQTRMDTLGQTIAILKDIIKLSRNLVLTALSSISPIRRTLSRITSSTR